MVDLNYSILCKEKCTENDYIEAIDIIKLAKEKGVKSIVITPRYIGTDTSIARKEMKKRVDKLYMKLSDAGIFVDVHLGYIVNVNDETIKDILVEKNLAIDNTRYMLVDLGDTITDRNVALVYELTIIGITPIIVNPERYKSVIEKYKGINELVELGCLFQLDINSIKGAYGKEVKKMAKSLLKRNVYSVATLSVDSKNKDKFKNLKYSILHRRKVNRFRERGAMILANEYIDAETKKEGFILRKINLKKKLNIKRKTKVKSVKY